MRRSALARSRKPINRRSAKGKEYAEEYQRATAWVKVRSRGRCEIDPAVDHGCQGWATDSPHHRKFRSQGGSNAMDNLLDTCANGHFAIHRVMPRSEAVDRGLIVPRDWVEYPYEGRLL